MFAADVAILNTAFPNLQIPVTWKELLFIPDRYKTHSNH